MSRSIQHDKANSPSASPTLSSADPQSPEATAAQAIYTCPMHPQVRQIGPGSCPICGMALEPAVSTDASTPNPELIDMRRRFWIGLAPAGGGGVGGGGEPVAG